MTDNQKEEGISVNSYQQLSKLYLKFQRKRTILTILGVALASGVLFMILTLYFSNFINERDVLRKEENYEMVFFPENDEQIAGIINEDYVKSAYMGRHYISYSNTYLENAVYINVDNPYKINRYFEDITEKYGIKGEMNERLVSYYLQGDIGNSNYIICLMFLLMAVIFAIIGVGIIRNSIQLNTLEQVKDYGILRCIGATQGQLKSIIFLMGLWQELTGLIIGMAAGYAAALRVGIIRHIRVGIHIVPVAFVLIAFIGDLIFVMQENSKLVKKLTPVEAVRGRLSVKKQKIKARKRGIFGRVFGVEGEYAYKSLMGNKGRFAKSVASFGLGIAAFIIVSVFFDGLNDNRKAIYDGLGEYEIYYYNPLSAYRDVNRAKSGLPSYDLLEKIAGYEQVEESRAVYAAEMNVADIGDYLAHYDEEYLEESVMGDYISQIRQTWESDTPDLSVYTISRLNLYGYGDEEYACYEDLLIDGTLDVSEFGIVMVQQTAAYPKGAEDEDLYADEAVLGRYFTSSSYKLGDTIDIVDMERFQKLYKEQYEIYVREHPSEKSDEASHYCLAVYVACWQQLIDEGAYATYTVEGIVEKEKDRIGIDTQMSAIVPLSHFCRMTGSSEGDSVGVKYKLNSYKLGNDMIELLDTMNESDCNLSYDVYAISALESAESVMSYIVLAVIFVVTMSSINIINTSASNLHLRRQELAQLRVIGVSKKRLIYIVMLEGIITTITANVLGCVLGFAMLTPIQKAMYVMFQISLGYSVIAAVIGLLFSGAVLCGSIYVPIRRMSREVLGDLNAGGD